MREKTWHAGFWPPESYGKPKVVVESGDGAIRWAWDRVLSDAGYDVATCGGPDAGGGPCPLVKGDCCPLVRHADVVVQGLSLSRDDNADVLRTVRERYPAKPVLVQTTRPKAYERAEVLEGCQLIYMPVTGTGLVEAVAAALASGGKG